MPEPQMEREHITRSVLDVVMTKTCHNCIAWLVNRLEFPCNNCRRNKNLRDLWVAD